MSSNNIKRSLRRRQSGGRIVRKTTSVKAKAKSRVKKSRSRNRLRSLSRKKSYFKRGNKLSEPHQKYCRCVLHVGDKQSSECLRGRKWGQNINGKQCFNPYAVCSKSTSRKGAVECFKNLNLNSLPKSELQALANLKRLSIQELHLKQGISI